MNSNPANPIINTRSFGEDPEAVSDMVAANIEGARAGGLLTTAKHFPGHGDTTSIPTWLSRCQRRSRSSGQHRVAAVSRRHRRRSRRRDGGARGVPALDPDPNHVATISPAVVTGLLKEQMGFKGLVVTDALLMQGLMKLFPEGGSAAAGRAAVEAVKAGDDVLIIPSDLAGSYNGLLQAVRSGEIPESRIDESVLKILRAKAAVGLNKARLVDIDAVSRLVATPKSLEIAQEIADEAVTLVRDNHKVLPFKCDAGREPIRHRMRTIHQRKTAAEPCC